jgi:eukaryotic-like serine/threonine-protein kinase
MTWARIIRANPSMSLAPGARLGPYEIIAPLGVGGMGEVYRARDAKLNREVAIKILIAAVASDPDRLARFSREAQVLAALNHPNIAHVYGLEDSAATPALVMELVEGRTLADRIAERAIPAAEALAIARQIADGLETAHDLGIIHRDLKPANIKVREDGTVKILDFGLAKALDPAASSGAGATMSPTLSIHATQAGIILGTAAYMAPEQARGKAVDKRADIWSFGCVLYEMLTGARAFPGEDVTDTIVSVVSRDPDWQALPPEASRLAPLIRRCLKKDPKARLRDVGEARLQIDDILGGVPDDAAAATATAGTASPLFGRAAFVGNAAALIGGALVAAVATWIVMRPPAPTAVVPTRFSIVPRAAQPLALQSQDRDVAIAPDGTNIVYRAGTGRPQLVVRRIDQLDARPLAGSDRPDLAAPRAPFFSPDGRWVGFFEGTELKKVSMDGGASVTLCRVTSTAPRGASWGDDNTIVFATNDLATGLMSVSADGGEPKVLTKVDMPMQEGDHLFPAVLPNHRGILFTTVPPGTTPFHNNSQIAVLDLATGQKKILIRGGSQPAYVETLTRSSILPWARPTRDGYLLYAAIGTIHATRFDLDRLEVQGSPVPVVEQVFVASSGAANFAVSSNGTLVYVPGSGSGANTGRALVWVNRQGREEPIDAPPRAYTAARLSPDGTRVALDIRDQERDIWVWHLERHTLTRLTIDAGADSDPVWTPDSRQIVFSSTRGGVANLFVQAADGTGVVERLTTSERPQYATSITPDGKALAGYEVSSAGPDLQVFHLDRPGNGSQRPVEALLKTSFVEVLPELSADGRYITYFSNESGRFEIFVRPFPKVDDGKWQISTAGGGTRPVFARTGRELFYLDDQNALTAVPVDTKGPTFSSGNPTKLLESIYFAVPGPRPFDVSADGQRFLMIKDASTPANDKGTLASLVVVEHWLEELKARLPH